VKDLEETGLAQVLDDKQKAISLCMNFSCFNSCFVLLYKKETKKIKNSNEIQDYLFPVTHFNFL
jgi:hypothetical protein